MEQMSIFDAIAEQRVVELPMDHLAVFQCIEKRRRTNGITQFEVAELTGFNARSVRQIVKELVEDYGMRIGSGSEGFFMVSEPHEIVAVNRNLLSKGLSTLKRAAAFRRNTDHDDALAKILGQLDLMLREAA